MSRLSIIGVSGVGLLRVLLVAIAALQGAWSPPLQAREQGPRLIAPGAEQAPARYVFDVAVESRGELVAILERAELLSRDYPPEQVSAIALVLHGPELGYFDLRHYADNRRIIELASRLDARRVIEIKACQTMLDELDMQPEDLPGFIDLVPFGPAEVERLVGDGYTHI
jgi:intracellular sulfur oxidation DsrE/DsrF family protein